MNKYRRQDDDPRQDEKYGSKYGRRDMSEEREEKDEEPMEAACGGYAGGMGMMGDGLMGPDVLTATMYSGFDPVSGNPVPVGADEDNVRDDIPAMISEGEYVLPADVVKYHGLKGVLDFQNEAREGLMSMTMAGLIQNVDPTMDDTGEESEPMSADEKYRQLKKQTEDAGMKVVEEDGQIMVRDPAEDETPEGNEVEEAEVVVDEERMEPEEPTEEDMEDMYPTEPGQMAIRNTPKIVFMR